jgi:excisionase family DNA binding protein
MSALLIPLLKSDDVAQIFGVTVPTICRWHAQGRLRGIRLGRRLRFQPADVQRLIEQAMSQPGATAA